VVADGRLPPLRGPGGRGSPGAIICGDAAVREFFQPRSSWPRRLVTARRSGSAITRQPRPVSGCWQTRGRARSATPAERAARYPGPGSSLQKVRAASSSSSKLPTPRSSRYGEAYPPTLEHSSLGCARSGRRVKCVRQACQRRSPNACGRPDPLAAVTTELRGWFEVEPWRTSRELFERLQAEYPGVYPDGQLRTLQRRVKEWRREVAHRMVFGTTLIDPGLAGSGAECSSGDASGEQCLWICRCAWTTLARRPQLHRSRQSTQAVIKEGEVRSRADER